MKKILSAILALGFCLSGIAQRNIYADGDDMDLKYNSIIGQLVISGVIDERQNLENPYITAQVCDENGKLFGLNQTIAETDGSYKCAIGLKDGLPDNLLVKINAGSNTAVSKETSFTMLYDSLIDVSYETDRIGDKTRFFVDLSDVYTQTDNCDVIIAQYANGSLADVKKYGNDKVKTDSGKYYLDVTIEKKGDESKVLVWSTLSQSIPYAVTSEGFLLDTKGLDINFGSRDDELKKAGYYSDTLDGKNNYEVYQKAVSEIPAEFDVVSPKFVNASYEIYVSPNGNDNSPGTLEKPFRTLKRAIKAYCSRTDYYKRAWTTVYLREGVYEVQNTLNIIAQGNSLLNITSYKDENVVITTARNVSGDKFKLVTEENTSSEIIGRISREAVGNLYYCSYEDIGIDAFSNVTYKEMKEPYMSVNDENMILARYPNTYSDNIEKVIKDGTNGHGGMGTEFEIIPNDKKPFTWKDTGKICMWSQMSVTWGSSKSVIRLNSEAQTVIGSAPTVVAVVGSYAYPVAISPTNSGIIPSKLYYFNVFEEIDMPGEWCFDDEERRVYFYPQNGELSEADIISFSDSGTESIFSIGKSSNIIFNGLNFSQTQNAINANDCENVLIQNCKFKNAGISAVKFNDCRLSGIINSEFHYVQNGVYINGGISKWNTLEADRNFIQNNICTNSVSFCSIVDSVGNILSHNSVKNLENSMLGLHHSSENIIEYNDICAANLLGDEGGCIYVDGHVDSMYNHIRYNYIHDNRPVGSSFRYGGAIVVDDMGGNTYIYKNVIENQYSGISYNCGDNNISDSNVFINCYAPEISASSLMYGGYNTFMGSKRNPDKKISELRYFPYFYSSKLSDSAKWRNRYPKLFEYMSKTENLYNGWNSGGISNDSDQMKFFRASTGNYFLNNIFVIINPKNLGSKENIAIGQTSVANGGAEDNEYISETDPLINVPQFDGFDYNVVYNNRETSDFEKSSIEYFEKIGADIDEGITGELNVICFKDPDSDYLDLYWTKAAGANYYKITTAFDEEFKTVYNTTYTFNNSAHIKIAKSNMGSINYMYMIEAFRAGKNGSEVIDVKTGSAEFSKKSQKSDKVYIKQQDSGDLKYWKSLRRYLDSIESGYIFRNYSFYSKNGKDSDLYTSESMSENGESFIRLQGNGYIKKKNASVDDICWGCSIENNNKEVDSSTYVTAEAEVRFNDAEQFPEINSELSMIFIPSNLSPDREKGKLGNTVSFVVKEDSEDKYTLYGAVQNSVLRSEDNVTLVPIKSFEKSELFGKWIKLSIKVDMENGIAEYCLEDNEVNTKTINISERSTQPIFMWNCCNYIYSIDFVAFSENEEKTTQMDIKNVEVKRVIKKIQ